MSVRMFLKNVAIKCVLATAIILFVSSSCSATIDLSNVDFLSYRFFRYVKPLPGGDFTYAKPPPPSLEDHLKRAKAIAVYFRNVVLGNTGYEARSVPFVFYPDVEHLKENFQQKYGFRGERLVEQLGNGVFLNDLKTNYNKYWQSRQSPPARR